MRLNHFLLHGHFKGCQQRNKGPAGSVLLPSLWGQGGRTKFKVPTRCTPQKWSIFLNPFRKKGKFFPDPFSNFRQIKECRRTYPLRNDFSSPFRKISSVGGCGKKWNGPVFERDTSPITTALRTSYFSAN